MKKRSIRSMIIMLIAALVVTMMPLTASAASAKPGKVKGVTVSVGKVNKKTNTAKVTVKWKKVSGATGYEIWGKHGADGKWKKLKKVGRFTRALIIKKTSPGKASFKVRAIKKKKKGSFSAVKTKFITSKWNLAKCLNSNGGKAEIKKINQELKSVGATMSVSGNTLTVTYEVGALTQDQINIVKSGLANDADLKKNGADLVKLCKNSTGVKSSIVVYKYTQGGSQFFSQTFK